MIQIKDLKKVYSGVIVVNIPQLEIRKGESIGLVGNNGAGKTTLFRMILDLIRPEAGEVLSNNEPVAGHENWKNYTASYLDEGFLIDYLTPEEYFYFIGGLHRQTRAHVDDFLAGYADFFNGEILKKGKYIRDLSKGNQTKVGIASCLLQQPELLMLDEPFANIDPTTQFRLKNILKEVNKKGMTTLVSSHDLNHITDVCDRILLMEKGKIIKDMATNSSTLAELEQYFAIGDVAAPKVPAAPIVDEEENH
ncbi:ATP-binding cassette domain-containing protein [Mucilaginibacter sp.]|uniref:ABC transporter ATP-binding protein n=1 Tax=Mucilaginibacter sp. TaxID=1882438 RepID=UPI00262B0B3F|nr:ATP-binding cassette domain-containing protein [Mucilaginibacter sp.]MDB4925794.1 ATP-binding protein [Mucilaginibacter sp.]